MVKMFISEGINAWDVMGREKSLSLYINKSQLSSMQIVALVRDHWMNENMFHVEVQS
jgi:hypothetical protein